MKKLLFPLCLLIGLMLESQAQTNINANIKNPGKKDLIHMYKFYFLAKCTQNLRIDPPYTGDEVCSYAHMGLDKQSMIEIDSMNKVVLAEIKFDIEQIIEHGPIEYLTFPMCVLNYCYDKSETDDLLKLAKSFAKRMKGFHTWEFPQY